MNLTKEQIEDFNLNGFLIIKDFYDKNQSHKLFDTAMEHIQHKPFPIESEEEYLTNKKNGNTIRRLRQVYQRDEIFRKWMTSLNIRPILKELLQETPVLCLAHHNSIMTKMPKESSRTFWHQDIRYWNFENDNLISVWLSLTDENLDNGVLEFIPKSHKIKFEKEQFDKKYNFLDEHQKNIDLIKTKVHFNLKKGDVILFHCKTLHHANKNLTDKMKISFVYTVRAISNKPIANTRSDFEEVVLL